jgi:hypothetical protein
MALQIGAISNNQEDYGIHSLWFTTKHVLKIYLLSDAEIIETTDRTNF